MFKAILEIISKKEIYGVVVTIALSYFLYRTIVIILETNINKGKTAYEKKKLVTLVRLSKNIVKYLLIVIAVLTILNIYGVNVAGMITGLGITATLLGLALQDTFKDIINGISIILENYFMVGDIVKYNDFTGEIIEFGFKSTKIKNVHGEVYVIANRNIMEIKNLSLKDPVVNYEINLPYEQKVADMEKIITKQILPKIEKVENILAPSVTYLGVSELADSSVKYLIQFKCKRDQHWQAKREVNKIVLDELAKKNISVPYPQLEVHNNEE